MKLLIFIALLLSTLYGSDLDWLHDYDAALKQAKKEKKSVYLFIGADVCVWCDKFKKMTLSDKSVMKKLREDYILLYMSRDRHKIPSRFIVKGVPRHYFLTSEGKVIHEDRGSREIDGFMGMLDEVSLKK